MPAYQAGAARVSSTVTKRNPRPRKYASASERQAAYRARAPEVCFRAEAKTVETLDQIAETLDQPRADVLLSMTKFALANHDWARFGLTHKPLPYGYGLAEQEFVGPRLSNPNAYSDPALWEHSKQMAVERLGGHSARAMQLAGKIYRAAGGKYLGKRTKAQKSLEQWTAQDWTTKSGKPSRKTGERYLPREVIEGLTPAEYGATTRAKRKGTAAGQQFVKQPKRIAAKVAALKANPTMKKPTPAQLAARARFAEMARSGAFKRKAKRNPAKKTVSEKISQLTREGYPQKQAVAVALEEQRAGKVKATPRKRNPITETLIYGLPAGESRDYMEELLYGGGLKLTPEQVQKVLDAATAAGYHSFRVTGFDPTVGAAFVRTMGQGRKRKPNPATGTYGPFYGDADAPLTEAQIERMAESYMDRLDRQLMRGDITQPQYEREVRALNRWAKEKYSKRKRNPATGTKKSRTKLNPQGNKVFEVYRTMTRNYAKGMPRSKVLATFNSKADAVQYAQAYADAYGVVLRIRSAVL